jgi:hypothetical protein
VGFSAAIFRILRQRKEIAIRSSSGSTCVLPTLQTFSTATTLSIPYPPAMVWMVWMYFSTSNPLGLWGDALLNTEERCWGIVPTLHKPTCPALPGGRTPHCHVGKSRIITNVCDSKDDVH